MMIVEGVHFNEEAIKGMKKADFIAQTVDLFFLDRKEEQRRTMLSDIYDRITSGAGDNSASEKKAVEKKTKLNQDDDVVV